MSVCVCVCVCVYACVCVRGFEEEDSLENVHSALFCVIKKTFCFTFCVFLTHVNKLEYTKAFL